MTEKNNNLPPHYEMIEKMNDARFNNLEEDVEELKDNYCKAFDAIVDIREAIVRLTVIQENQQKVIEQERETLTQTIKSQNENIAHQNEILEKSMRAQTQMLENILLHNSEVEKTKHTSTNELSGKKLVAITSIISTIVTAAGAIITKLLDK